MDDSEWRNIDDNFGVASLAKNLPNILYYLVGEDSGGDRRHRNIAARSIVK